MTDTVLEIWQSLASADKYAPVIPDGCRDLIFRYSIGERPRCFVSDLAQATYDVAMKRGDRYWGFRLLPGTRIDEEKLLISLSEQDISQEDICDRLQVFTHRSCSVAEVLDCLAFEANNISHAASMLGVSPRSLQRLMKRETGRSPVFWLQLARARRAARALTADAHVAKFSISMGYADQAHMSREFRRWFGVTPAMLKKSTSAADQLMALGYGSPTQVQISTRKPLGSLT